MTTTKTAIFRCECECLGRTRCVLTDHEGNVSEADYCDGCIELARIDWNGETAKVEPQTVVEDGEVSDAALACVSEAWDADGSVPYHNAADFLAMCLAVYGEAPALRLRDTEWVDETGAVVLVPAD